MASLEKKIRQEAIQRCSMLIGDKIFSPEMTFHIDQLAWFDETGCRNKDSIRAAGYALRGMTPVQTRFLIRGKRVSCIAAIAYDGLIALEATTTTVDAQIFFDFACGSLTHTQHASL